MMDTMSKSIKICDTCGYKCAQYAVKDFIDSGADFVAEAFPVAIPKEQYVKYLGLLYKKAQKTNECADWIKKADWDT